MSLGRRQTAAAAAAAILLLCGSAGGAPGWLARASQRPAHARAALDLATSRQADRATSGRAQSSQAARVDREAALTATRTWVRRVHWTSRRIAPGVTVRHGVLDQRSAASFWTVTIDATARSPVSGGLVPAELGTRRWADATARRLRADGYRPRVTAIRWPLYADSPHGREGMRVRIGHFNSAGAALSAAATLHGQGFGGATAEWTGVDADHAPDAEQIHAAVVSPSRFRGLIQATHDGPVGSLHTTSAAATARHALVAVNGGFFIVSAADGFPGAPAGLGVYRGRLESMSAGARGALVLGLGRPRIERLSSAVTVLAGRSAHSLQGVNRLPGVIEDCGRPDARPATRPQQDVTCGSRSELVLFTSQLGAPAPAGPGTQAVIGPRRFAVSVGARHGAAVPAGGEVLQGIGRAATWLRRHVLAGHRVSVRRRLSNASGGRVPLRRGVSIVAGAPVLLRAGRLAIDAIAEGVADRAGASFNYSWAQQRQPRTIAGVGRASQLILVTVDGRQPGVSEGATLVEEALLMRSLGAVSAVNLDGGGSATMVVRRAVVNRPSGGAERADGDFVVVLPSRGGSAGSAGRAGFGRHSTAGHPPASAAKQAPLSL